jgi:hypothetical protein
VSEDAAGISNTKALGGDDTAVADNPGRHEVLHKALRMYGSLLHKILLAVWGKLTESGNALLMH